MRARRAFRVLVAAAALALAPDLVAAAAEDPTPVPVLAHAPVRVPGVTPPLEQPFLVADGVARRTLAFGREGLAQTLDVYGPVGDPTPRPTVLLVHGGGWQIGDSTEWATQAVELVRSRGWTAVALNYRLAPEDRWPAPYEDAAAALRLLHARSAELGVDPARIGAVGDSAGAQLAALLGEPAPDRPAVRSVVTWSGLNDLTGLLRQRSSGGCAHAGPCARSGLTSRVVDGLMGCTPAVCPTDYRDASPAAVATGAHAATLAISSEGEQVDPRQAWAMDGVLGRAHVPSRVHVLPGSLHARGFQATAWPLTLRFLAATLTPETAPAYPRPAAYTTLDLPARSAARVGRPVSLSGAVRPRALGTSVALEVRAADGTWRTARTAPLQRGATGTTYAATWTPARRGTYVWRATWHGGGGQHSTLPRVVVVR